MHMESTHGICTRNQNRGNASTWDLHINTSLIFLMYKAHENFCQILMCYTFAHEAEIDFMCTLVYRMVSTVTPIENWIGYTQGLTLIFYHIICAGCLKIQFWIGFWCWALLSLFVSNHTPNRLTIFVEVCFIKRVRSWGGRHFLKFLEDVV